MIPKIDIIIVDDEPATRRGLISFCANSEINLIGEANNGKELFELLKIKKPHLILLDLEMPVLNGSKTLNRLQKEFPTVKVIIVSRYYDEELIKDIFNRGAKGFVSKDIGVEKLPDAIKRVAAYGIYEDNLNILFKTPCVKDGHYYKMILTPREIQLIPSLLKAEKTYKQIAGKFFISENTVNNHAISIFKKTKVKNRLDFIILATKSGLMYLGNLY